MFHCPYEGCSQVYVALSSFQVSVNSPARPAASPSRGRTTWRYIGAPTPARPPCSARSVATSAGSARRSTGT
ncbi:ZNF653 isoform 7, partial [Pan troglodytes]